MFSYMNRHFGTAGLVVAIVALIAALAGGAYAASNGLTGKQKNEVKKISQTEAKKFATAGAPGAPGAAGAAGPQGKEGPLGKPGKDGLTGFTETLPTGKTETGTFSLLAPASKIGLVSVSYSIPLAEAPTEEHIKVVKPGETEVEGCEGGVEPIPTADPGFLCLYITESGTENSKIFSGMRLTNSGGAVLNFLLNSEEPAEEPEILGAWAVTAE